MTHYYLLVSLRESVYEMASFSSPFLSPPRSVVHCEVSASPVPLHYPAFINLGFVCRSQEVVKLSQNQAQRQLNKKAPVSQLCRGLTADPEQMLPT